MHGETRKHTKNVLIISTLSAQPPTSKRVRYLFLVQDPRHPAQRKKSFWSCGDCKSRRRAMVMQAPQAHVVSRAEQAAILEIDNNDGEDANDPLDRSRDPASRQADNIR